MTDREARLRRRAIDAGYAPSDNAPIDEPLVPTPAEEGYLAAIDMFRHGFQCRGWDAMDLADLLVGVRS